MSVSPKADLEATLVQPNQVNDQVEKLIDQALYVITNSL